MRSTFFAFAMADTHLQLLLRAYQRLKGKARNARQVLIERRVKALHDKWDSYGQELAS